MDIRVPHTRREHAEATARGPRPFAAAGPPTPNFVEEMLAAGDGYNPRMAYRIVRHRRMVVLGRGHASRTSSSITRLPEAIVDAVAVTNPAMLIVAVGRSWCGANAAASGCSRSAEPSRPTRSNWLTRHGCRPATVRKRSRAPGVLRQPAGALEEISAKLDEATQRPRPRQDGRTLAAVTAAVCDRAQPSAGRLAVLAAAKLAVHDDPDRALLRAVSTFRQPWRYRRSRTAGDIPLTKSLRSGDRLSHVLAEKC